MQWSDVFFKEKYFVIRNTKNGRDHIMPMTKRIKSILIGLKNDSEWVFASPVDPSKPASMAKVIERASEEAQIKFTAHDLRRTVATLLADRGFSEDRISVVLNHSRQTQTSAYIQRTADQIRPLLEGIDHDLFEIDNDLEQS
jgi:integrase